MVRGSLSLARAAGLGPLTAFTACPARRGGQGREPRGAAPARGRWGSEPLLDHVSEQVDAAVRVAPLVVVPAHELEEVAVELDRRAGIVDARTRVVDEVGGDDLL